jgi:hypothetical protein
MTNPVAAIVVILSAAVGYLAGQVTGGETALLGAIVGCLIVMNQRP